VLKRKPALWLAAMIDLGADAISGGKRDLT
jgi:hypothetical protein